MSRGTWSRIRQSTRFYVDTYRRALIVLLCSVSLSILLCLSIYISYFGRPSNDFYATDGITPPIPLTAMSQPNASSVPLLANDQNQNENTKAVPY